VTAGRWRGSRRWATAFILLLLIVTAVAVVMTSNARTPEQRAALSGAPPPSYVTVPVEAGPLVDRVEVQGSVRPGPPMPVAGPEGAPAGTDLAVVTAVYARRGELLHLGRPLLEVSGRPLFALEGRFPPYRDLRAGDEGSDVRQLQRALGKLGMLRRVSGVYDSATTEAVRRLYRDAGYRTPHPDASAGGVISGGANAAGDGSSAAGTTAPDTAHPTASPDAVAAAAWAGRYLPRTEVLFVSQRRPRLCGVHARVGLRPGNPVVSLCADKLQFSGALDQDQATRLNRPGAPLAGTMRWRTVQRRVVARLQPASSESTASGQGAAVTATGTAAALFVDGLDAEFGAGGAASVTLELGRSSADAVVVPVAALWQRGDSTGVIVDDAGRWLPVDVELTVGGLAAVRAPGVSPGDAVAVAAQQPTAAPVG
jgi:peptidoglycan hydrolase-like protein with peptidoglycan-binding domain